MQCINRNKFLQLARQCLVFAVPQWQKCVQFQFIVIVLIFYIRRFIALGTISIYRSGNTVNDRETIRRFIALATISIYRSGNTVNDRETIRRVIALATISLYRSGNTVNDRETISYSKFFLHLMLLKTKFYLLSLMKICISLTVESQASIIN